MKCDSSFHAARLPVRAGGGWGRIPAVAVVSFTLLAILSANAAPAVAQDKASADPPLLTESRELLASIAKTRAEFANLREERKKLEGEEAVIMERRLRDKALEIIGSIDTLAQNLTELDSQGIRADDIREPTKEILLALSAFVHPQLELLKKKMAEVTEKKAEASGEELIQLEAQQSSLDESISTLFRAAVDNIRNMEALGLPTAGEKAFLGKLLEERASNEMARVSLQKDRAKVIKAKLESAPDDAALKADLGSVEAIGKTATSNLQKAVGMMNDLGMDTSSYRKFLIETTGELTTDLLDKEVALNLFQQWGARGQKWLADNGPGLLFKALIILTVFLAFFVASRVVRRVVEKAVASPRVKASQLLANMLVSASGRLVVFVGILVALSQMGVSLGPVLAGLGIAGFVIGFALQEVLGNFAAGMMILIYKPFDVGDMVEAAGVFGKVNAMSMVSTSIMTIDNQTLIVPNGKIWGDVIKNVTGQQTRRVDMEFGISYSDDIPRTEKVLMQILAEHPKVLKEPAPVVRLHKLGESSVDFVVRPWVATEDYWDVYWDVTREVKMRFDREGISIPFPQRDVHLHETRREGKGDGGGRSAP